MKTSNQTSNVVTLNKVQINKNLLIEMNKLPTKSAKIRFLNSKKFTRSEIAKLIEIRYQHVRNVLITPIQNQKK